MYVNKVPCLMLNGWLMVIVQTCGILFRATYCVQKWFKCQ